LENLRFHVGETKNDPEFASALASLADVYINDAFGTAHRAHASTVGIAERVKEKGAGLLLKEELENLSKAFSTPARPVVAIFGGAKVSDKLRVLNNILDRMDVALIGGGMANSFLKAQGCPVGTSRIEEEVIGTASEMLQRSRECEVILPVDVVVSAKMEEGAQTEVVKVSSVPAEEMCLDIGPETIERFRQAIGTAKTIIWNGPMGVFEISAFSRGTMEIAKAVADSGAFSVVGGGDTIRAVEQAGVGDKISYISTGGGAFMEFMEGKTLPGVAALES
jgi:phosphoglycerate kinase